VLAFSGGVDAGGAGFARDPGPGALDEAVKLTVAAVGVVVKQHEAAHVGVLGEIRHILQGAVSPADPLVVLLGGVLCVMDDDVRAGQEVAVASVFAARGRGAAAAGEASAVGLVVGGVHDRLPIDDDPIADGDAGVVEVLRGHGDVAHREVALLEITDVYLGVEVLHRHGEIVLAHLPVEQLIEALVHARGPEDGPALAGLIKRREERDPLNVVPVGVRDEQAAASGGGGLTQERLGEAMKARPRVEDDEIPGGGADLDAGGVAAVPQRALPGLRDGASGAPETDLHESSCAAACPRGEGSRPSRPRGKSPFSRGHL
jgi:hypothetical protein